MYKIDRRWEGGGPKIVLTDPKFPIDRFLDQPPPAPLKIIKIKQ